MSKAKGKQVDRMELKKQAEEVELDVELDELEDDDLDLEHADDEELDEVEASAAIEVSDEDFELSEEELEAEPAPDDGEFDSVAHYFRESARHRLLSPERTLTEAVKRGRVARRKLQTGKSISKTQTKKLRDSIEAGGIAREELVRN